MNWDIFLFILIAGVFLMVIVVVLETATLSNMGIWQNIKELWATFFGSGKFPDE